MRACSIRALWILSEDGEVCFSRRFPTVEREWRRRCAHAAAATDAPEDAMRSTPYVRMPYDPDIAAMYTAHVQRNGKSGGCRDYNGGAAAQLGLDSWVDDPILRHVISLAPPAGDRSATPSAGPQSEPVPILWPIIVHTKGPFQILVMPLVEERHVAAYGALMWRRDCGGNGRAHANNGSPSVPSLSSILLQLTSVTGAFVVAQALGDLLRGDVAESDVPHLALSGASSGSVGGLFDSLSSISGMSMTISGLTSRSRSSTASPPPGHQSGASARREAVTLKPQEKESLRAFIATAMPFGVPIDVNPSTIAVVRSGTLGTGEIPEGEQKTPAWKPFLPPTKARPRIALALREIVNAAVYDRESVEDTVAVSGQVECRAELEGLPDVTMPLACTSTSGIESITLHSCAQAPDGGVLPNLHTVCFSPPLGPCALVRYHALPTLRNGPAGPPLQGFYQLQMVSDNEGAFLLKMKLLDGYKPPIAMDYCSLSIPFPRNKIVGIDGSPSTGSVVALEHSIEWKIVSAGRGLGAGKAVEASFSGTVRFAQEATSSQERPPPGNAWPDDDVATSSGEEDEDEPARGVREGGGGESRHRRLRLRKYLGRGGGRYNEEDEELPDTEGGSMIASWDDPFCREAYNYAKASFKLTGGTVSGISIDPKMVIVYPPIKATIDVTVDVVSGEYIFWNSLGSYSHAAASPQS